MFLESVFPTFTHMNQFLQRDEPLIHILHLQLTKLLTRVLGKFMKTSVLTTVVSEKKLAEINYKCSENRVDDEDLIIGMMTKHLA